MGIISRSITVQDSPSKKEDPNLKITKAKRTGGVAQKVELLHHEFKSQ
jgi:hypothetical protein